LSQAAFDGTERRRNRDQHYTGSDFGNDIVLAILFVPLALVLFVVWATVEAWKLADGWLQRRDGGRCRAAPCCGSWPSQVEKNFTFTGHQYPAVSNWDASFPTSRDVEAPQPLGCVRKL
jgi:hypothetical protein